MPRREKTIIEYRSYDLPAHFPILLVAGEDWRLSDVPAGVLHFHNCLEIGLCESDAGMMQFGNETLPFQAGNVSVVAGDVPHTTWSDPGMASKWSYLFVDPEELLRPFFPPDRLPNAPLLTEILHGWYAILTSEECPQLIRCIHGIQEELRGRAMNYEITVRGLFLVLITDLMRLQAHCGYTPVSGAMVIAPALEYINRHYMESFGIGELADICRMSPSHFRRVFHELMGISPLEQLNRTRITRACSLLRMTDSSILAVSEMVGFRSLSSFNRHFSAMMGVTPTEWRRAGGGSRTTSILKYSGYLTPPRQG